MNNKMDMNEIYDAVSDISNSLYNLNKNGAIYQEDYKNLKIIVDDLYSEIGATILYGKKEND